MRAFVLWFVLLPNLISITRGGDVRLGSFTSFDKRRHLLTEKGATLTDCRYLVAEKGGISTQESPSS